MFGTDICHQGVNILQQRKVSAIGFRIAPDLACRGFQLIRAAAVQQDVVALSSQRLGCQKADPVRRAGDKNCLGHVNVSSGVQGAGGRSLIANQRTALDALAGRRDCRVLDQINRTVANAGAAGIVVDVEKRDLVRRHP